MHEVSRHILEHNGLKRTYRLFAPHKLESAKPLPLVIVLHGGRGDGERIARQTKFDQLAQQEKFLACYPDGVNNHWNDGRGQNASVDDVGFMRALINSLVANFSADPTRVYVTGASNGGMMTLRLAIEIAPMLAAVAPVIASIPEPLRGKSEPEVPVPILIINGEKDPLVPWEGGEVRFQRQRLGRVISTAETVAFWVKQNNCAPEPQITYLPSRKPENGTRVRVERYTGQEREVEVILYAIEGGGHTWPGGSQFLPEWIIGKTNRDINASVEIWKFFKRHRRDDATKSDLN